MSLLRRFFAGLISVALGVTSAPAQVAQTGGGLGAPSALVGAMVRKTSNQTGADYSTPTDIAWDGASAVVFDTNGFYSSATNTRLTVPAPFAGNYGVVCVQVTTSNVTANTNFNIQILRSTGGGAATAAYDGFGGNQRSNGAGAGGVATDGWIQACTQPIVLSSGDYFVANFNSSDSSIDIIAASSSFSIRIIGATLQGALIKRASDQTANFSTFPNLAFDGTDIYDTDGFHDPSSNNTRITVQAAVNGKYGVFQFNMYMTGVANNTTCSVAILKNGAVFQEWAGNFVQNSSTLICSIMARSQPVLLTTSDFYEFQLSSSDTSTTVVAAQTTAGLYVIPQLTGALAIKAANQTTANYSTPTAVAWPGTDVYDTNAFHNPASSPADTQIVIPADLNGKYGILAAQLATSGATLAGNSSASIAIQKGGSIAYNGFGGMSHHNGSATDLLLSGYTMPVLLTTGDVFTASLWINDTSVTLNAAQSSFGIMILNFNLDPANDNAPMFLNKVA